MQKAVYVPPMLKTEAFNCPRKLPRPRGGGQNAGRLHADSGARGALSSRGGDGAGAPAPNSVALSPRESCKPLRGREISGRQRC